ncbi:FecR family protein [Marinomonas sp. 15G1-11]|uniref:FecR family protein n=1 Tax=Marinomonas phaeophyticola TaxID=3004091 RepID=A0ABT4JSI4_9GAMM|nr:FecR family protein [Marinomonas sp. 15G1-11]MCZ2721345.1 FecR family protein [Marinomonas sp. 15G1-11]
MTFAHATHNKAAGEVSFVIGKAYLSNPTHDKKQVRVKNGTPIFEGDHIVTANGGHVHIRFIDDGMVSVRPNSALAIDYYQYDATNPKASVIRFDLSKGVARSISGKGAKAARDKFRLNTPIAAIGVRGTDFVVSAKSHLIQAVVNEGAIVVAPFSAHCSSDGFGPCEINSVELNGLSKQLLEMSNLSDKPTLIPLSSKFVPELMEQQANAQTSENEEEGSDTSDSSEESTEAPIDSADSSSKDDVETNDSSNDTNDTSTTYNPTITDTDKQNLDPVIAPKESDNDSITDVKKDRLEDVIEEVGGVTPPPENYVPNESVSLADLDKRQLVWGRWSNQVENTDRIVATRSIIAEDRSATVGTTEYVLYRNNSSNDTVAPNLGNVRFNLVDAQAVIHVDGRKELMTVSNGWLNINFNNSTFDTGLSLNHTLTSDISMESSGLINNKGYFNSNKNNGTLVSGASTLDGTEASYLFQKEIELGKIEGLTYWNGKP